MTAPPFRFGYLHVRHSSERDLPGIGADTITSAWPGEDPPGTAACGRGPASRCWLGGDEPSHESSAGNTGHLPAGTGIRVTLPAAHRACDVPGPYPGLGPSTASGDITICSETMILATSAGPRVIRR